jgi:hypothetical protein
VQGLDAILLEQTPGLYEECVAFWWLLAERAPNRLSTTDCAAALGYRNRHQFTRWMGMHGYPCFTSVADWVRLVGSVLEQRGHRQVFPGRLGRMPSSLQWCTALFAVERAAVGMKLGTDAWRFGLVALR